MLSLITIIGQWHKGKTPVMPVCVPTRRAEGGCAAIINRKIENKAQDTFRT